MDALLEASRVYLVIFQHFSRDYSQKLFQDDSVALEISSEVPFKTCPKLFPGVSRKIPPRFLSTFLREFLTGNFVVNPSRGSEINCWKNPGKISRSEC